MKDILKVKKRTLLLIAGAIWGFAGFRVFTLGFSDVESNKGNFLISLIFAAIVFYIFFNFIFLKMFKKHTKRIINKELENNCLFSFFDWKGYIIMGFMIFFGVTVRNLKIFNPVYLGTFYMGLGFALFMAGVYFLVSFFKFKSTKIKYGI